MSYKKSFERSCALAFAKESFLFILIVKMMIVQEYTFLCHSGCLLKQVCTFCTNLIDVSRQETPLQCLFQGFLPEIAKYCPYDQSIHKMVPLKTPIHPESNEHKHQRCS